MDSFARAELDPAVVSQIAHESAAALLRAGRAGHDSELTERLVRLVDELGLDTIAELWSKQPARSLPGCLWRLYALREWIRRDPASASADYRAGLAFADVAGVVAGVGSPPGPEELRRLADAILRGVFDGDVSVALHRAGAFCRVVAAGRAADNPAAGSAESARHAKRAASMLTTGEDLDACARLWARNELD
ncbi:MAG: hypothetical protein Q4G51_05490 [Dermatophilus congolensis]|nr:hypothetical protein [Dermatophilus congolensis]